MQPDELSDHRKKRMQDFVNLKFGKNKAALGRALGYLDGAFVGQMIRGERPITEKTISQINALPGGSGWFEADKQQPWNWPFKTVTPQQYATLRDEEREHIEAGIRLIVRAREDPEKQAMPAYNTSSAKAA